MTKSISKIKIRQYNYVQPVLSNSKEVESNFSVGLRLLSGLKNATDVPSTFANTPMLIAV